MDKATSGPTPAQLAKDNLVAVTPTENGEPLRSWDSVHQNFPPIKVAYATPVTPPVTKYSVTYEDTQGQNYPSLSEVAGATFTLPAAPTNSPGGESFTGWGDGSFAYQPGQTYTMPAKNVVFNALYAAVPPVNPVPPVPPVNPTPPTPTPPSGTNPSGISITPLASGYTRALSDDFTGTSLDMTKWTAPYSGVSGGTASGLFIPQHTVFKGDSILRLQAYPDPSNIVHANGYTPDLAASVNQWGGAGTKTQLLVGPGSVSRVCMKFDVYPGIAPMAIFFGDTTESDFAEINQINAKGQAITKMSATIFWGNHGPSQGIEMTAPSGVDFAQWGVFEARFSETGLEISHSIDGVNYAMIGLFTFTPTQLSGGVLAEQNLCLQIQTGDVMPNPPADPSVTASSPVELWVDWVTVDVAS